MWYRDQGDAPPVNPYRLSSRPALFTADRTSRVVSNVVEEPPIYNILLINVFTLHYNCQNNNNTQILLICQYL